MKKTAIAIALCCLAGPAAAGGLAGVMEVQDVVVNTPAPTHDWVVLVLLAAVLAAFAGN